jgi:HD superfamily phosphohydrolase
MEVPNRAIFIPKKTIRIPKGLVNLTDLVPIIEHLFFQNLAERKQLGMAYKVFPGALHSRLEHSLGTLARIRDMIEHFQLADVVLKKALEAYALDHDIGHGPYSHEFEQLIGQSHEDKGRQRLLLMKDVIGRYADFDLFMELYDGKHPLSPLVHDRNFGADKLDYLQRDAYHVGYEIALNTDAIIYYLQYQDGQLGVDEKSKEVMMAYQFTYMRMYHEIYFQKTVKINARMLLRALTEVLGDKLKHPEDLDYMWEYSDAQLMQVIADHPLAKLFRGRQHCKTTCVLKIEGYESEERRQDRLYPVIGIPRDVLRRWSEKITDRLWLVELEHELEAELGLPQGGFALVVQPNFYEAVVPKDLLLYCYTENRFQSLFERVPSHPLSLQEVADRAFFIRVAVDRAHTERAMKFDYLQFFQKHLGS